MKEEEGNHLIFTTTGSCLVKFQKRKARRLKNHSPPSYYHGSLDSFVLPCEHIQNPYAFFRSPSDCTLSLCGLPVLGQAENLWCPKVQGAMTGVLGVWTSITWVCPISAKVRSALVGICFHQFFHLSCLCFKTVNTSETDFSMIPLFALLPEIHFF